MRPWVRPAPVRADGDPRARTALPTMHACPPLAPVSSRAVTRLGQVLLQGLRRHSPLHPCLPGSSPRPHATSGAMLARRDAPPAVPCRAPVSQFATVPDVLGCWAQDACRRIVRDGFATAAECRQRPKHRSRGLRAEAAFWRGARGHQDVASMGLPVEAEPAALPPRCLLCAADNPAQTMSVLRREMAACTEKAMHNLFHRGGCDPAARAACCAQHGAPACGM